MVELVRRRAPADALADSVGRLVHRGSMTYCIQYVSIMTIILPDHPPSIGPECVKVCSLSARKHVDPMVFSLQVGQAHLCFEWSVRLLEVGGSGGGAGLTISLTCRMPRCRAIEPALSFLGGGKYGSEQAHLLSHHYRNETVSLSLKSVNAPDRRGRCA